MLSWLSSIWETGNVQNMIVLTILLGILVFIALIIIAWWKIFEKAGEKGWKSIIPFYNIYIIFKICWSKKWFWIFMLTTILPSIISEFVSENGGIKNTILSVVLVILLILEIVIYIVQAFKLSKSFGHKAGYGFGLLFLPNIFTLIIAYGRSKYVKRLDEEVEEIETIKS